MNLNDNVGTTGGAADFVKKALASIGGGSGSRTSNSVSSSNNSTIQFNPTIIANAGGGSPEAAPYNGAASGSAPSTATSSAAGQDPSSLSSRALPAYRTTPNGSPLYDPLNIGAGGVSQNNSLLLPLLIGGGLLLFGMDD